MDLCERTGKHAYPTAQDAWAVIRARQTRGSRKYRRQTTGKAYQCPACRCWHVTQNTVIHAARAPWEVLT